MAWSASGGVATPTTVSLSDGSGTATGSVLVGPLSETETETLYGCLPGGTLTNGLCATYTVGGVHGVVVDLTAVSGAGQSMAVADVPAPVVLRAVMPGGHGVGNAAVVFYETLRQWQPGCGTGGRCAVAPVLARQTVNSNSDADGLVALTPLGLDGVATRLEVVAESGGGTLSFEIERHP